MMIYFDQIAERISVSVKALFPDEELLPEEIEAALQAFYTSIRWAVLISAKDLPKNEQGVLKESVEVLETTERFETQWMSREEIVDRIENTSGLPQEISDLSLVAFEKAVEDALKHVSSVVLENIGTIALSSNENNSYIINLAEDIKLTTPLQQKSRVTGMH